MILLLSNSEDYSTAKVTKWLYHIRQDFIRVNAGSTAVVSALTPDKNPKQDLLLSDRTLALDQIKSYWYRRGFLNINAGTSHQVLSSDTLGRQLNKLQSSELQIIEEYLYFVLAKKKALGSFHQKGINKLLALNQAQACGLRIPKTLVTGNKTELSNFLNKHSPVISKPIFETPSFKDQQYQIFTYTSMIEDTILKNLEERFFPSLFQEAIPKKYELRIFYLDGECYANAIFSQMSKQSAIDSRLYNHKKPNRRVPYQLPKEVHKKIQNFMQSIHLNCGSIDMIYSQNKEYVFLEVNPIGQFGMTSYLGNYRLEQKIAKYLADA